MVGDIEAVVVRVNDADTVTVGVLEGVAVGVAETLTQDSDKVLPTDSVM